MDRDYPAGASIREVSPADDVIVDARGRTIINGIAMDPSSSSSGDPNFRDLTQNRRLPPIPAEGGRNESQSESKLHTWLLQGMALRGKAHWKDCADYYERHKPVAIDVFPKEDNIKHDQYTKAFSQIGQVPSTEGRLMTVVEQVVIFEQNILLSPACEFYAKLLLHGMYHFLEQLRGLKTATEQATQTFATSQAEELFHPQLEALLVTWLSNKLPEVVRKRAHNRRSQPSARILLTEFYFTLFPQPDDQAKHLGNIARNPTSTSQNPTDVIINIETWRTSIQMLKDISGYTPMKEDICSAFEKLIAPLAKHDDTFSLTKPFVSGRRIWQSLPRMMMSISTSSPLWRQSTSCRKPLSGNRQSLKHRPSTPVLVVVTQRPIKERAKAKERVRIKALLCLMEKVKEEKEKARVNLSRIPNPPRLPKMGKVKVRVLHLAANRQEEHVTKKPLPADPADVQRLKGKLQSVPKPANSAVTVATPVVPVSSSGATASTAPVPVLQVSMLRVD